MLKTLLIVYKELVMSRNGTHQAYILELFPLKTTPILLVDKHIDIAIRLLLSTFFPFVEVYLLREEKNKSLILSFPFHIPTE